MGEWPIKKTMAKVENDWTNEDNNYLSSVYLEFL